MRIAYFVDHFPRVSETFILNQIKGISDLGQDVTIFANRPDPSNTLSYKSPIPSLLKTTLYESDAYKRMPENKLLRIFQAILLLKRQVGVNLSPSLKTFNLIKYGKRASSLALFYTVLPYLEQGTFDIIHCQYGTLAPKALMLKEIGAIRGKVVVSFRGFDLTQYVNDKQDFYQKVIGEADLFLPVSRALKNHLLAYNCSESKIIVHHSGINVENFPFRLRTRGSDEKIKVLSVGRLVPKKGLEYAIKAVSKAIKLGHQISYTIVGDGQLREVLEQIIQDQDVQEQIQIAGAMTHEAVIRKIGKTHIFLAPSITAEDGDQEGIPNVLKEAMAAGLPVLSTYHGGIPELVQDNVSGYLVPERDTDALAEKLIFLCDHQDQWTRLGQHGRTQVENYFNSTILNRQLLDMYRQLLEQEPSQ